MTVTPPKPATALPPLMLLRAFDAAGRLGSFRAAAEALHVTASAISHQISDLEAYLGVQLFRRQSRGIGLTAAGQRYLGAVADAFQQLRLATLDLKTPDLPSTVRISCSPFFCSEFLLAAMDDFDAQFPGLDMEVSVTESLENPSDGQADFAIRFGQGHWPQAEVMVLAVMQACPVMAPGKDAAALARIDFRFNGQSAWAAWQARGLPLLGSDGSARRFSNFDAAVRAAEHGLGLSLGLLPLINGWLESGRLICVPGYPPAPVGNLCLLSRPLDASQPGLRAVRDWLFARFSQTFSK